MNNKNVDHIDHIDHVDYTFLQYLLDKKCTIVSYHTLLNDEVIRLLTIKKIAELVCSCNIANTIDNTIDNTWFEFNGVIWQERSKLYINNVIKINTLEKYLDDKYISVMYDMLQSKLFDSDFRNKCNKNNSLIAFNNGIVNFNTMTLRNGEPSDYITKQITYDYSQNLTPDDKNVLAIKQFLNDTFDNKINNKFLENIMQTIRDNFVSGDIITYLEKHTTEDNFLFFVECSLGPYCKKSKRFQLSHYSNTVKILENICGIYLNNDKIIDLTQLTKLTKYCQAFMWILVNKQYVISTNKRKIDTSECASIIPCYDSCGYISDDSNNNDNNYNNDSDDSDDSNDSNDSNTSNVFSQLCDDSCNNYYNYDNNTFTKKQKIF